jgi:hypothetical protein
VTHHHVWAFRVYSTTMMADDRQTYQILTTDLAWYCSVRISAVARRRLFFFVTSCSSCTPKQQEPTVAHVIRERFQDGPNGTK